MSQLLAMIHQAQAQQQQEQPIGAVEPANTSAPGDRLARWSPVEAAGAAAAAQQQPVGSSGGLGAESQAQGIAHSAVRRVAAAAAAAAAVARDTSATQPQPLPLPPQQQEQEQFLQAADDAQRARHEVACQQQPADGHQQLRLGAQPAFWHQQQVSVLPGLGGRMLLVWIKSMHCQKLLAPHGTYNLRFHQTRRFVMQQIVCYL
jgi:hypothetical protein